MLYDTLIRHAHLHRQPGLVDIGIKDGQFVHISAQLSDGQGQRELDVEGRLVTPPFIDAHVHLDAVLTVGQPRYTPAAPCWRVSRSGVNASRV